MIIGVGHLKQKLEKLSEKLGVNKNITFLGLVSEEDKILAYNACDIFILPSLAELEASQSIARNGLASNAFSFQICRHCPSCYFTFL